MSNLGTLKKALRGFHRKKSLCKSDRMLLLSLEECLTQPDEAEIAERLRMLLNERWKEIGGGKSSYTCVPHAPTTQMCFSAAQFVQQYYPDKNIYTILMPSLNKLWNCVTQEEDLENYSLDQLILSEDLTHLIPAELLANLVEDMELNELWAPYTHDALSEPTRLTYAEQQALIAHNTLNRQLYTLHQDICEFKEHPSIGQALNTLSKSLKAGATDSELFTQHRETYICVSQFFEMFDNLPTDIQEQIHQRTMGFITAIQDSLLAGQCVAGTSNRIQEFLREHPELYDGRNTNEFQKTITKYRQIRQQIFDTRSTGVDHAKRLRTHDVLKMYHTTGWMHVLTLWRALIEEDVSEATLLDSLQYIACDSGHFLASGFDSFSLAGSILEKKYFAFFEALESIDDPKTRHMFEPQFLVKLLILMADRECDAAWEYLLEQYEDRILSVPSHALADTFIRMNRIDYLDRFVDLGLDLLGSETHRIPWLAWQYGLHHRVWFAHALEIFATLQSRQQQKAWLLHMIMRFEPENTELFEIGMQDAQEALNECFVDGQSAIEVAIATHYQPLLERKHDLQQAIFSSTQSDEQKITLVCHLLATAIRFHNIDILEFLLQKSKEAAFDLRGKNLLVSAVECKNYESLSLLLQYGLEPSWRDHSCIQLIMQRQDERALDIILKWLEVTERPDPLDPIYTDLLLSAIEKEYLPGIARLLQPKNAWIHLLHPMKGPNRSRVVDCKYYSTTKYTPFEVALETKNNMRLLALLLEKFLENQNSEALDGKEIPGLTSAFLFCAYYNEYELVNICLRLLPNFSLLSGDRHLQAMQRVIQNEDYESLHLALASGYDPCARTPSFHGAVSGMALVTIGHNEQALQVILEHLAQYFSGEHHSDIKKTQSIERFFLKDTLGVAVEKRNWKFLSLLLDFFIRCKDILKKCRRYNYYIGDALLLCVEAKQWELAEKCLPLAPDFSLYNKSSRLTAIEYVLRSRQHCLLQQMLEEGCSPHDPRASAMRYVILYEYDEKGLEILLEWDKRHPPENMTERYTKYFHEAITNSWVPQCILRAVLDSGHVDTTLIIDNFTAVGLARKTQNNCVLQLLNARQTYKDMQTNQHEGFFHRRWQRQPDPKELPQPPMPSL